jgi:hypothetical protein
VNGPLRLTVLGTGYLGITQAACVADLSTVVAQRNILDGRSVLGSALWRAAGWNYRSLGVAVTPPLSTRFVTRRSTRGQGHSGSR